MANSLVLLAEGFEEIEALTVVDVLRRGGIGVVTAAIGKSLDVRGAHGISVKADKFLSDLDDEDFDALVLPGGGAGTENLKASHEVFDRLHRQKAEGRLICAICAAPTILVDAEILEPGQHITCYPTCIMDLDRPCAKAPVVADGNVITGQAPGSAMLFSLVILQTLTNSVLAHKIARGLVTDVFD